MAKDYLPNQVLPDVNTGSSRDLGIPSLVERHTAAIRNFHKFMAVEQILVSHHQLKICLLQQESSFLMLFPQEKADELLDQPLNLPFR